ncbi:MAG: GntR family transcriptional regulator [Oscillospiraceae bacterium]|nr:GntR family transcriptional regulator [Oscillospiraceae bacterium]
MEHRNISIADQVFEQLEREILAGKYPRGELLSEQRLSAELGVSRTPVREAIRRLEQENILEDTSRGVVVVGITREDMLDMFEIRLHLEGLAARRAAERISDEQLRRMRDALDLQHIHLERQRSDSSDQIKNLDSLFHELLYASCGSKVYFDVLNRLHKKIAKYRIASVRKRSRAEESIREHEAIYEALAAHDPERTQQAVLSHTERARASMAEMEL